MRRPGSLATLAVLLLLPASCGLGGGTGTGLNPLIVVQDWARTVSGTGERWGRDVAANDTGTIALVGAFNGEARFGEGSPSATVLQSTGGWNSYIAVYDDSGNFEWAESIEGQDVFIQAVAMDSRRSLAVAGYTSGTAIFRFQDGHTETVTPPSGSFEVGFLAVFDSDGTLTWMRPLLGDVLVQALDVDFDRRDGNVVVGGIFQGTATLGDLPVFSDTSDGFVLQYSEDGELLNEYETVSVAPGFATIWSVASFDRGDVLFAGDFQGSVDLGSRTLLSVGGSNDIHCARLSLSDHAVIWADRIGGSGYETVYAIDVSEGDDIMIAGEFQGSADIEVSSAIPGTLTATAAEDAFVARFDPEGTFLWANVIGGSGHESAYAAGLSRDGDVIVTGTFNGDLNVGRSDLVARAPVFDAPAEAGQDAFLLDFRSNGALRTSYRLAGVGEEFGMGAAIGERRALVASGATTGETTVTRGTSDVVGIQVTGDRAGFLVHFRP